MFRVLYICNNHWFSHGEIKVNIVYASYLQNWAYLGWGWLGGDPGTLVEESGCSGDGYGVGIKYVWRSIINSIVNSSTSIKITQIHERVSHFQLNLTLKLVLGVILSSHFSDEKEKLIKVKGRVRKPMKGMGRLQKKPWSFITIKLQTPNSHSFNSHTHLILLFQ